MSRPSFSECLTQWESSILKPDVMAEITSILRTLSHGKDPRTVRVVDDSGTTVGVKAWGKM